MKKNILIILMSIFFINFLNAQEKYSIYDVTKDGKKQLEEAIIQANNENKNVLVQVGFNTCSWCVKVHKFYTEDAELDSIMKANFVLVMINYSKENKNLEAMEMLDIPQRFGFPVFVVLNKDGERIHTQDSWYLEKDSGYNKEFIKRFLQIWSPEAYTEDKNK